MRTITTTEDLAAFCEAAKGQPYVTIDTEFLRLMVRDHQADVALYQREFLSGRIVPVRIYAIQTVPALQRHLQIAKTLLTLEQAGEASEASLATLARLFGASQVDLALNLLTSQFASTTS